MVARRLNTVTAKQARLRGQPEKSPKLAPRLRIQALEILQLLNIAKQLVDLSQYNYT
jgi:hypothetical protein